MAAKLTQVQVIAVHSIMSQHCSKTPDGVAAYEEGWDDARVHAEMATKNPEPNRPISLGAVAHFRLSFYGRVKSKGSTEAMAERIDKLEERAKRLEEALARMEAFLRTHHKYSPPIGRPVSIPPS